MCKPALSYVTIEAMFLGIFTAEGLAPDYNLQGLWSSLSIASGHGVEAAGPGFTGSIVRSVLMMSIVYQGNLVFLHFLIAMLKKEKSTRLKLLIYGALLWFIKGLSPILSFAFRCICSGRIVHWFSVWLVDGFNVGGILPAVGFAMLSML